MDGKDKPKNIPVSGKNGQPIPLNGGRPKGVPNKATTQFKEGLNNLFEYATPQMVTWLEQIDSPERRFDILAKFADYLYPKLARTEIQPLDQNGDKSNGFNVQIVHVKAPDRSDT
jgi:hypothetical protein